MSRTKGSGWGAGPMLWQKCALCDKKKALYDEILHKFYCTSCKQTFEDDTNLLKRTKYVIK
jgi:hypothetical protein